MSKEPIYEACNINPPGRVNLMLRGRFRDVQMYDLSQEDLKELYDARCPYVRLSTAGLKKTYPTQSITTSPISLPGKDKPKPHSHVKGKDKHR